MFWNELKYDDKGLVCGVFQDYQTGEVLMVSWLNREAVGKTWRTRRTQVYRRSRGYIMMKVEQVGGAACAHGYRSCFCERVDTDGALQVVGEMVFDPAQVYGPSAG